MSNFDRSLDAVLLLLRTTLELPGDACLYRESKAISKHVADATHKVSLELKLTIGFQGREFFIISEAM